MADDRLAEIRERWAEHMPDCQCDYAPDDVPYLLGLADALARLVEREPRADLYSIGNAGYCVFCESQEHTDAPITHTAECPWRQARELLGARAEAG